MRRMNIVEMMFAKPPDVKGQQVFSQTGGSVGATPAWTQTFTVPAGVYLISMVCVGSLWITANSVVVCKSHSAYSGDVLIGDGGGSGGVGGPHYDEDPGSITSWGGAGGGGAAGYSGNGGAGGRARDGAFLTAGSGGGGGGGYGVYGGDGGGGGGGGVGLLGQGSSGAEGGKGGSGGTDSGSIGTGYRYVGGDYGGGRGSLDTGTDGSRGAHLRYTNNVSVVPGQVITITAAAEAGFMSAARIMWGGGRSYPSNAGNL